ncbi:MAG TPA: hypothetical protein VFI47_30960 [Acidimicrobiales bacterium]|nr:hypothetical protein [Acidimicrobiales bacterium]
MDQSTYENWRSEFLQLFTGRHMTEIAYALSSEGHDARTLVETVKRAEAAGFHSVSRTLVTR